MPNERRHHLSYLYTVLVVAFGESIKSATRITSVYSFTSVIVGCALGLVVRYARRLKPLCVPLLRRSFSTTANAFLIASSSASSCSWSRLAS